MKIQYNYKKTFQTFIVWKGTKNMLIHNERNSKPKNDYLRIETNLKYVFTHLTQTQSINL